MIVNVTLSSMLDARRLVGLAENIPCAVELCCGRFTVDVKSMLGVLALPRFEPGQLHVHSDDDRLCRFIMEELAKLGLLAAGEGLHRSIYDITVFGEILIDFTRQGLSDAGQVLFARNPGGAPANVAVAASRLGARTAFLGKAGQDMHGEFLRSVLDREQVCTRGMLLDQRYFTTLAFVDVAPSGERTFSFARKPGADTQMQKEELDVDILDCTNIFHVGSLSLTDQPSRDTTVYAVKRARARGSIVSYDPNYRASLWPSRDQARQQMRSLIPYVDVMKLSDEETALLTDCASPEAAAAELFRQGVKVLAVTLGEAGAYVYCKDGGRRVPGFPGRAVDTNGAGDSFWGGFLTRLSRSGKCPQELSLDEAADYARYANAVASLCVERPGAIPAMPTAAQVQQRLGSVSSGAALPETWHSA